MTFVANCRDVFFPVTFPPSPFGFRRYNASEKYWRYTSNLYRSTPPRLQRCASLASKLWRKGNAAVYLQFVLQHGSHLYRSKPPICTGDTFEKIPGLGGSGKFLNLQGCPSHFCSHWFAPESECREAKIAVEQLLLLSCRAITLTAGAILKEENLSCGGSRGSFGGMLRDNLRVIASQNLLRDNPKGPCHTEKTYP